MPDIAELTSGFVKGRFLYKILDTDDAGVEPEGIPFTGHVEFTATTPALKVANATPPRSPCSQGRSA